MEKTPKTSFIPKQNVGLAGGGTRKKRRLNLLSFFAVVVFLGTLTLSVGVFFYKQYSENQLEVRKRELASSRSSYQQGDIESIRELDRRLRTATNLLDKHVAVSKIFDALERRTQSSVQLGGLEYTQFESGNIQILTSGAAPRFNTVALQEFQFSDEPLFDTVTFSDINVVPAESGGDGEIVFTVSAELNGNRVLYEVIPTIAEESLESGESDDDSGGSEESETEVAAEEEVVNTEDTQTE